MDCLCVGHALKESLTATQALDALCSGVKAAGETVIGRLCVSDGGDGFLEAVRLLFPHAQYRSALVHAPHGELIRAAFLYDPISSTAVIESAAAIGLRLVPPELRSILRLGSFGLGELILAALEAGAERIVVGLGGSATCDGGLGMLAVLSDSLSSRRNQEQTPRLLCARDLANPPALDIVQIREFFSGKTLTVCTDVESPLCGPHGAAHRFAPQKGATPAEVVWLDEHLALWARKSEEQLGATCAQVPGAGAAGGLGFAFCLIGANLTMGSDFFLGLSAFGEAIQKAEIVLTSEGRFDATSLVGKAPWRVAQAARQVGAHAAIFCGTAEQTARQEATAQGIDVVEFAAGLTKESAYKEAASLLAEAVATYLRHYAR